MDFKCNECGVSLTGLTSRGDKKILIKSRALIVSSDGGVAIRCHHCKNPTSLPLRVDLGLTRRESAV